MVPPVNSPVRLGASPAASTPTGFTARGFEALVSHSGTLGWVVYTALELFLLAYLHANVGLPSLQAAAHLHPSY